MNSLFAAFILFFGSAAVACPELSGRYMCPQENSSELIETVVTKTHFDGVLTFILQDAHRKVEFVTDGYDNDEFERFGDKLMVQTINSRCSGVEKVISEIQQTLVDENTRETAQLAKMKVSLSRSSTGSLVLKGEEMLPSRGAKTQQIVCKKK